MAGANDSRYKDIRFIMAESNDTIRFSLMGMLRQQGFRNLRPAAKMDKLIAEIKSSPADLIAVADSMGAEVFDCIRKVRHNIIGKNLFVVVTFMAAPDNAPGIKRAVMAGVDDVLLKPVAPGKIVERAKHIAYNRSPFIATTEYIGPDRRKGDRKSSIPLIEVVNTLRDKLDGKNVPLDALAKAIGVGFLSVRTAQLDSQGMRLGYVCNVILKAYENGEITPKVEDDILTLVGYLEEADKTAKMIGEHELGEICITFARQVEELAESYENPAPRDLDVIRKLTKAFALAKGATAGG